jgi:two-component system sensor histidine kinase AlgZ
MRCITASRLAEGGKSASTFIRSADKVTSWCAIRSPDVSRHKGNRIALDNIRERLLLHFI